jgi:hypothetical protein
MPWSAARWRAARAVRRLRAPVGDSVLSRVTRQAQEAVRKSFRIGERDQVASGNDIHLRSQTVARNAPLELDGEEAILRRSDDPGRDLRPAIETARFREDGFCLVTLA